MTVRKVHVKITHNVLILADDDFPFEDIIKELECEFTDTTGRATIVDTEMGNSEVIDSR